MKDKERLSQDEILWGVHYLHSNRSKKAQEVDNAITHHITNNPFQWMDDPSRHDFPLIDTQIREKPKGYTRARGRNAADELTEFFKI